MRIASYSLLIFSVHLGLGISIVSGSEGVIDSRIPIGFLQEVSNSVKVQHQSELLNPPVAVRFVPQNSAARISKRKAIFMSMLLPGLGERSIGSYRSAKLFYSSESSLWLSLFMFQKRKEWKREDYQAYAAARAGVSNEGKNDQFYSDVSNFSDVDEFNAAIRRSREPESVYNGADEQWSWSTEEERLKFKSLKLESDNAGQNIKRIIGAMLVNRIFSVMNTIYRYNKLESPATLSLDIGNFTELSLTAKF